MKILALGNSFSEDATAYLEHLAPALYVRNLHIPGCSLETHAAHLAAGDKAYVFQEHGRAVQPEHVAANDIMAGTPWDVVTVQQASRPATLSAPRSRQISPPIFVTHTMPSPRSRTDA